MMKINLKSMITIENLCRVSGYELEYFYMYYGYGRSYGYGDMEGNGHGGDWYGYGYIGTASINEYNGLKLYD